MPFLPARYWFALALVPVAAQAADLAPELSWSAVAAFDYAPTLAGDHPSVNQLDRRHADGLNAYGLADGTAESDPGDGLTLGAYVELNAALREAEQPENSIYNARHPVKQAWLHGGGDWGDLRIGRFADARAMQAISAPQICGCGNLFGTNAPALGLVETPIGANTSSADLDDSALKLGYFSPEFAGFHATATYAQTARQDIGGLSHPRDLVSVALTWRYALGSGFIDASAGATATRLSGAGLPANSRAAPYVWDLGALYSYGPWKIGGAYEQSYHFYGDFGAEDALGASAVTGLNPVVNRSLDLGINWSIGPFAIGLVGSRGLYEGLASVAAPKRQAANDLVQFGGSYQWRPQSELLIISQFAHYDGGGVEDPAGLMELSPGVAAEIQSLGRTTNAISVLAGAIFYF